MAANERVSSNTTKETIEQLQARYQRLNTKKIQAETNLDNAKTKLKELQDEARQKFKTDDVMALRAKLEEMKADNEKQRSEYQASLDAIEKALQAVETSLRAAETPSNDSLLGPTTGESA